MTNEEQLELIAQAKGLCEAYIKEIETEIRYYDYQIGANIDSIRLGLRQNLNSWLTHRAEMDEHRAQDPFDNGRETCGKCTTLAPSVIEYPCDFIVTKARRLLGVKNDPR